jgi:hypothetical protein
MTLNQFIDRPNMRTLAGYLPVAAAIAVIVCCLLASLPGDDFRGQRKPAIGRTATAEASPASGPSETALVVDALRASGSGPNDKAVQQALAFVARCQNARDAHRNRR